MTPSGWAARHLTSFEEAASNSNWASQALNVIAFQIGRLPRAFARRQDRGPRFFWPIEAHHQIDRGA